MATSLPTYTGDATGLVNPTGRTVVDAIIGGSKWGTGGPGTGAAITYSFPAAVAVFDTRPGVAGNYNATEPLGLGFHAYLPGFSAFSAAQQEAARQVLQAFASVANLSFSEVPATTVDAGTLRFGNSAPPGVAANSWGVSWFPQDLAGAGDTWMNSAFLFPEGWAAGTQNFLTLLHEVGHALGLKHPHDRGLSGVLTGWPVNTAVLPFTGTDTLTNESTQSMVMAYKRHSGPRQPG
jgi:serralysin